MRMREFFCLLLVPMVSLGFSTAQAAAPSNVRIDFVHPERFTDFRIQGRNEFDSARIFQNQVSEYLAPILAKRFPGETLSLTFTDINLAGSLPQSHIRNFNNVRFDRDGASPLQLQFAYTLADSKGRVTAKGSKSLVDSDYLYYHINYPNSEKVSTLFYEKVALSKWVSYLQPTGSALAGK
jgi:hypothetical protein